MADGKTLSPLSASDIRYVIITLESRLYHLHFGHYVSMQIPHTSSKSQPRIPEVEGEADLDPAPVPESPEVPEDEAV